MASPPPERGGDWLSSGFPPRSFPPGPPASPPASAATGGGAPGGRGRWLVVGAAMVAMLLLAAALFAATRGDDDDGATLATGSSTSVPDTTFPVLDPSTTAVATTIAVDPVSTTVAAAGTTTSPNSTAAAGNLEASLMTLTLPKADATVGASRGNLTLRNIGGSPLSFTTESSSPALSAAPARGNLGPGASVNLSVTLDGARITTEGPFNGTLAFGGTGGTRTVTVQSTIGRPPEFSDNVGEPCPQPSSTCSRQIKLAPSTEPNPSPCNTPWAYAVTITDQSEIQSARAIARRGIANSDAPLVQSAGTDLFVSNLFIALTGGTVLRFTIEAVDVHGFGRRLPEQTIACP